MFLHSRSMAHVFGEGGTLLSAHTKKIRSSVTDMRVTLMCFCQYMRQQWEKCYVKNFCAQCFCFAIYNLHTRMPYGKLHVICFLPDSSGHFPWKLRNRSSVRIRVAHIRVEHLLCMLCTFRVQNSMCLQHVFVYTQPSRVKVHIFRFIYFALCLEVFSLIIMIVMTSAASYHFSRTQGFPLLYHTFRHIVDFAATETAILHIILFRYSATPTALYACGWSLSCVV